MKTESKEVRIEITRGDITRQADMEAVVNAANAALLPGGGVAGAIHRVAGHGLREESVPLGPIQPGEAVITGGHNLPNKYVIHCLGPIYGRDKPEEEKLGNCYRNAIQLAAENGINSIAFPSISTGAFGYPVKDAARIALKVIDESAGSLKPGAIVRMVLFSPLDYETYSKVLEEEYT